MFSKEQSVLCVSPGVANIKNLAALVGCRVEFDRKKATQCVAVLAWGKKPSARTAESVANELGLPVLRLEDGFLRSVELGNETAPLSLVLDDLGIYYDARSPSRIEILIQQPLNEQQTERARKLIHSWRACRVSKYNQARERNFSNKTPYVLVVDQTFGDASIEYGLASAARFVDMLDAAATQYPEHQVIVKTHPDVVAGHKKGHFSALPQALQTKLGDRLQLIGESIHAPALLEHADAAFCVTSQMGFEALLWGKPTYVFGMPFYAGWGLTHDALPAPPRRTQASLEQLVHAALIRYPHYVHPESGVRCEAETVLEWMGLQRQQQERFPPVVEAVRWSRWKRPLLRAFMRGSEVRFVKQSSELLRTVGWGASSPAPIKVEDGFIRSVGLGADLIKPQSWVIDDMGMYYDARKPSRLENILASHPFEAPLLERAARLREQLLTQKITKYNVGRADWQRPEIQQRVVLVPGQVESDASIQLGSPQIKSNLELLKQVRTSNPEAYVVYKPHPDVQAGLRKEGSDKALAHEFCDEIVFDQDMAWLLGQIDEVHTLTSLTGFEALLRGRRVVCYGHPFYAGWGLTTDIYAHPRRGRSLSLEALVAGTLILYPTYLSHRSGYFCTPEQVITEIALARTNAASTVPIWRRIKRKLAKAW